MLRPRSRRVIVTPEAGSRPVGTEASRRSARSPASALHTREGELAAGGAELAGEHTNARVRLNRDF